MRQATYTYDEVGNRTAVVDYNGHASYFVYDLDWNAKTAAEWDLQVVYETAFPPSVNQRRGSSHEEATGGAWMAEAP